MIEAKSERLRWVGHVIERKEDATIKQTFNENQVVRKSLGRPKKPCKDQVKLYTSNTRLREAEYRKNWRRPIDEAKYHLEY